MRMILGGAIWTNMGTNVVIILIMILHGPVKHDNINLHLFSLPLAQT